MAGEGEDDDLPMLPELFGGRLQIGDDPAAHADLPLRERGEPARESLSPRDEALLILLEAEQRKAGEVWKGPSGRWFTKNQGGRTVPAADPSKKDKAGAAKKEPAAKQKTQKLTVEQAHALVRKAGADPKALTQALLTLKAEDVKELRHRLGHTKGSGAKQKLVDELVAKVTASAPAKAPGKSEQPKAPAARPKEAPAASAMPQNRPPEGPPRSEAEWRAHPSIAALGPKLAVKDVESPHVQKHLELMAKIPPATAAKIGRTIKGVHVGLGPITGLDDMGYLKGVAARGHGSGTWDNVSGAYNPTRRVAAIGHTGNGASASTAVHELGHALDQADSWSSAPDFVALHKKHFDRLRPYYKQGGPGGRAGCEELFAELFAHSVADRASAVAAYGEELVSWMDGVHREYA
jgi:hypothetical protein